MNPYADVLCTMVQAGTPAQQSLRTALSRLMPVTPAERIGVKMLCEKAKVGRTTFYTYYHGVFDVLRETEDLLIDDLTTIGGCRELSTRKFLRQVGQTLGQHMDLILGSVSSDTDYDFMNKMRQSFRFLLWERLCAGRYDFSIDPVPEINMLFDTMLAMVYGCRREKSYGDEDSFQYAVILLEILERSIAENSRQ